MPNDPHAKKLLALAAEAMQNAYSPYSKFSVGAALESADGKTFKGCNVENASYGLTICAERSAVFSAVAEGCRRFTRVAIVASGAEMPYPCGACRQVLFEFGGKDMIVYIASAQNLEAYETASLGELLPKSFEFGPAAD